MNNGIILINKNFWHTFNNCMNIVCVKLDGGRMNWSKAKNILIVAFIATNLFLLYEIFVESDENKDITISNEFINKVVEILDTKNISINCSIPKEKPSKSLLTVRYQVYNSQTSRNNLADKFLKNYVIINDYKNNALIYKDTGKTLTIKNNNEITYKNYENNKFEVTNFDKQELENICTEFLEEKEFSTDDYKLTNFSKQGDKYILQYTKFHEDILIEESYMIFEIGKNGIQTFKRKWLDIVKTKKSQIVIRSAPDVLLRLLSREDIYGKSIEDIDICYYFSSYKASSNYYQYAIEGDAVPAWRIQMKDGQVIVLEEY